ncbi:MULTISPECIES: serine hydrolase domain-containing protein [Halomicrobium]|uniref:Beta-lactamase n=2 Tax=Halomicrobium mukohataei TaxID=57705 RepID=C7P007_HALMD|nr:MULTISPECIES: serine hydrolase domain-containing protein [Halomicrobium]ACV46915.1 beta-lactamase [Halomicrobium mukohataei DSM 12286]QCD65414.1 serine hydrolase [Halomicrobium mukohataei]QFR20220.1 serine hydrolase [Halomicrobium sp. ZPS1]
MNTRTTRRGLLGSIGAACAASAAGDVVGASGTATTQRRRRAETTQNGAAFVDDTVERLLSELDIDGAAVSLVTGAGETIARGYGQAYRSPDTPMDPSQTLVEIGSISKAITWTALMQLVDRGRIAVDDAVADHLTSVTVPQHHGQVKLWHLPTHTPGFEARVRGDKVGDPTDVRPLAESVRHPTPAQVRPPGEMMVYTNWAAAVAGQLVSDVTGDSFPEYVDRQVFEPLGMTESTFETAPAALVPGEPGSADDLSWYSDVPPASGMCSTAADMGRFLHAHLHHGDASEPIMSSGAYDDMHQEWFSPHERIRGMAFGFAESSRGDTRLLEHGGSTPRFSSKIVFAPALGVGLFVSAHGRESPAAVNAVEDAFLDRFVGSDTDTEPPGERPQSGEQQAPAGQFRPVYVTDSTTYDKVLWTATTQSLDVTIGTDGKMITTIGSTEHEWIQIEPDLYQRSDGGDTLLLESTEDGTEYIILESRMVVPYERVSWIEQYDVQIATAAVAMLVSLLSILRLSAQSVRGVFETDPDRTWSSRPRWAEAVSAGWPFAFVLTLVSTLVAASAVTGISVGDRAPPGIQVPLSIPLIGAIGTVVAVAYAAHAWRESRWSLADRLRYSGVVASSTVLLWLCDYWNLVGVVV